MKIIIPKITTFNMNKYYNGWKQRLKAKKKNSHIQKLQLVLSIMKFGRHFSVFTKHYLIC